MLVAKLVMDKSASKFSLVRDGLTENRALDHQSRRRNRCDDMALAWHTLVVLQLLITVTGFIWLYQRGESMKDEIFNLLRENAEFRSHEKRYLRQREPAIGFVSGYEDDRESETKLPAGGLHYGELTNKQPSSRETAIVLRTTAGIPTSNIAHLYGDPAGIEKYVKKRYDGMLYFKKNVSNTVGAEYCDYRIENGRRDIWCPEKQCVMIRKRNAIIHKKNFDVLPQGKIQVKTNGMFIIQAQAFFYSTNAASIKVIRETQDGDKSVITACFLKTSDVDKTDWTLPCNVFNVVGLKANDKVYLDLQSYAFFRVRREALHFSVIKLNSQSIATEAAAGS